MLVTGGAGFIGSHVVRQLVASGRRVRVLDLPGVPADHLPRADVALMRGDVAEPADARRAVAGCAAVLHLAADPNLWRHDPRRFDRTNHRGTVNVIAAAAEAGAERIVHVSTESILAQRQRSRVIDETTRTALAEMPGPYCRSKWLAEAAAERAAAAGAPVVIASPTVPVGPGDRRTTPLTRLIVDFAQGRVRGRLAGDIALIDVRDAAAGVLAALERGRPGARYLLAAENWTIDRLFEELSRITGRPAPRFAVPYALALGFAHAEQAWCAARNGRPPMATVTGVKLTRRGMRFDARRSTEALGLRPRPVAAALREAVAWLREAGRLDAPGDPVTAARPARARAAPR